MMRVFYGVQSGHAHRYQCRGDDAHVGAGLCIGIGGIRVDRAVTAQMLAAVSGRAVEAALIAAEKAAEADGAVRRALERDLEAARYDASLAARRHELVDPAKRHVARELEARWNAALERVVQIERRIADLNVAMSSRPKVDRDALMRLAQDLPAAWNAPTADARTRQRLTHILIHEVVIDLDDVAQEAVLLIHWVGGRHSEVRVPRVKAQRPQAPSPPSAVEVIRRLAPEWPDRQIAITLNRVRCPPEGAETWTTISVRQVRERLGIAECRASSRPDATLSVQETALRLGICVGSVHRLIREGNLPATQVMWAAPWKVPTEALSTDSVVEGVRIIKSRRPKIFERHQRDDAMRLPGI